MRTSDVLFTDNGNVVLTAFRNLEVDAFYKWEKMNVRPTGFDFIEEKILVPNSIDNGSQSDFSEQKPLNENKETTTTADLDPVKSSVTCDPNDLYGGGDSCYSCGTLVYIVESVRSDKNIFHSRCFRCDRCGNKLLRSRWNCLNDKYYCRCCFEIVSMPIVKR